MPNIITSGRVPLSFSGLLEKRLEVLSESDDVINAWWSNHLGTGDAAVYDSDGNMKIVLDSDNLRGLNKDSIVREGVLVIDAAAYSDLRGEYFSLKEVEKYAKSCALTRRSILNNPILKALARDDSLLKEYAKAALGKASKEYDYGGVMGVYARKDKGQFNMCAWLLGSLKSESYVGCNNSLHEVCNLVGVLR